MTTLKLSPRVSFLLRCCLAASGLLYAGLPLHGQTNMTPIAVSGFNRDVVVESTSSGPPFSTALEFNAGEGTAFYQSGLPSHTYGLPASGSFTSAYDNSTVFQFQPYTTNNALVLGPDTGLTTGTLTLVSPATYNLVSVIANSGNGTNFTGLLTFNFIDGSKYTTTYNAPNWFNTNQDVALEGVERISLANGTTSGAPTNPRFYQTTINLAAALGSTNKPLASLTFGKAIANTTGIYAVSGQPATNMTPIAVTGFNRDVVIESNSSGPPYTTAAEYNPGEGTCFYQSGLSGTTYGLPASGAFTSALDSNTVFQFQPFTTNNALVMSSETGINAGTLTLVTPGVYSSVAILANSASGGGIPAMTFNFTDGSSYTTNFNAQDWFFNTANVALLGVDRINISGGGTDGGPTDPRFYQTTVNLAAILGANNKPLASITFNGAAGAGATAVYAVSGLYGSQLPQTAMLATVTNLPATGITANSATLSGQILSTGGSTPMVNIYYGTTDGGTNAAAWAQSLPLGAQSGGFSGTVFGLSSNTTYYFTAEATNSAGVAWATPSLSFTTPATNPVVPQVAVLTYHNDNARDGVNTNEVVLTPGNVNVNTFGQLISYPVDGYVYGQPLVMTNVTIPGKGVHNVLYVVTEHESVYAFDADANSGTAPFWQVSFLNPGAGVTSVPTGDVGTSDITPEIGITATPVIDPTTGTIYLEAKTKEVSNGVTSYVHRLHALDITTGAERSYSPVIINCTNYPGTGESGYTDTDGAGHVLFNTQREHSRPAVTLYNGVLFVAFASHGDNSPYHGWLFAYNATNFAQISVFNSTPNGGLGGFWQGGGGATIDPQGNLYYMTGNGDFNATGSSFVQGSNNFAMSVLKFTATNGNLKLVDYFSPHDEASLSGGDEDLGSGAPLVLPDSVGTASHPHLLAAAGKGGRIYLIDRDNMGRFNSTTDQIVQELQSALGSGGQNGSYMTPAFFNNTLYYISMNYNLMAFPVSNGLIASTPSSVTSTVYGDKGSASPSISANGTNNAIIWAIENDAYASSGPAILHAYNATNLQQELYNSSQNASRDYPGGAVKFACPTIANGHVYVGAEYAVSVYGTTNFLPNPLISPNGGTFTNSVTVTLSDSAQGTTLYYTLDGTMPTTNSFVYTGPFVLTNSAGITVIATKPGALRSGTTTASFVNSSSIGTGTGLLGDYWTQTTSQQFTNVGFSTPPTLVRTDAVVNFNWGAGSPDPSISVDHFVARWTGAVEPQFSQTYTFSTTTDDGARLWINNQLIIDHWQDQGATTWSGTYTMQAQQRYNIRMEYYENGGSASAVLSWSSPSTANAVIPQTQLYPVTNPPPAVQLVGPTNGQTFTGTASVTLSANAAAQYNSITNVAFYANGTLLGNQSNSPYILTTTGLAPGNYTLTAVAWDGSGLTGTSAPVNITINTGTGQAYGLTSRPAVAPFLNMPATFNGALPLLLSQTGAFTNVSGLGTIPALIPYSPITPLWSDGAVKTRWFCVPNNGAPYNPNQQIGFSPTGEWSFPSGTIFVKHFELVTNLVNPNAPRRRLETRLLVRDNNGAVYGVTYKWRPDNSDADLLTTNMSEVITITNAGGTTTQTWYYPSPSDCLVCHTPAANYVLGVKTRQLNTPFSYPSTGVTDNELRTLNRLGLFNPAIDEAGISNYTQLVAVTNQSAALVDRVRSYLDANCAQCHRPGGTGPTFDARWDTPLANQNIINAMVSKGSLGFDNARIVAPDDIWRSILYDRVDTLNSSIQMPPLARNLIDTNAVPVLAAWINSLPGIPALAPPVIQPAGGTNYYSVNVTLLPPDSNATLYYTLDGSLPTTNSLLYSGPFALKGSATVNANAFETGYTNSVATNAMFTILPGVVFNAPGAFTNGTFQISLSGQAGQSYVLQASSDLVTWTNLSTNVPASNRFVLSDPGATNYPHRFYRAVLQAP